MCLSGCDHPLHTLESVFSNHLSEKCVLTFFVTAIGGKCGPTKSIKKRPPILQHHVAKPQSLGVTPESAHVLTIVLLTSSSLTTSAESHWKPSFTRSIIYQDDVLDVSAVFLAKTYYWVRVYIVLDVIVLSM